MSDAPTSTAAIPEPIPCGEILYRLLTKASWISQDGDVALAAFYRRDVNDNISVFKSSVCPLEEAQTKLGGVKAIVTLHTGRVRDMGLRVVTDLDNTQHAEILGIPLVEDDIDGANYYADGLAEQARIAWRR